MADVFLNADLAEQADLRGSDFFELFVFLIRFPSVHSVYSVVPDREPGTTEYTECTEEEG
jgi:hypothetical protein